ncbi:MAG: hypothetical protein ACLQUW_07170 [Desulfobaccales bacterium]
MQEMAVSHNIDEKEDSSRNHSKIFVTNPKSLSSLTSKEINFCLRDPEVDPLSQMREMEQVTGQSISIGKFVAPIIEFPSVQVHINRMVSLQKWQGYVLKVLDDSLWVRLIDLTQNGPDEEAEISLEEISRDDFELIKPGAIFYWNIGYLDFYSGQRIRSSVIRFQRMPAWSDEEIDAAREQAELLQNSIHWE